MTRGGGVKKFENVTSFGGGGGESCPLMTIDDEGEGGVDFWQKSDDVIFERPLRMNLL